MDLETGALATVIPKLDDILNKKYNLTKSTREDVEYLSTEMKNKYGMLLRLAKRGHPRPPFWAEKVRELSYDMELVVDQLLVRPIKSEGLMKKMCDLFEQGKSTRQQFAAATKLIRDQFQDMAAHGNRFGHVVDTDFARSTMVDPFICDFSEYAGDVIGIDGKAYDLMELLSDGNIVPNQKMKTVSIVGSGGLGKTTLAKTVYDKINMGFDCSAFVPAGRNADPKVVLKSIIFRLSRNRVNIANGELEQPITKLREMLENKRYLLVIDDIWNENLWTNLRSALSSENNLGSRIITTTRIISVSEACCSSANDSIYRMEPLSDYDSKQLFYQRIFGSGAKHPHEFELASEDILKKCAGVPLAIIAIASVLIKVPLAEKIDQCHVLLRSFGRGPIDDSTWKETQKILSLSYYDLPSHLRTCLLQLSIFPGSKTIEGSRVVEKWIAEGIVNEKMNPELSLEEAGSMYLGELVDRNVIHPMERNNNSEVLSYHIHPMLHGVLKAIATEVNFAASLDDKDIVSAHRMNFPHLSIDCQDSETPTHASSMAAVGGVRSLTVFGHANRSLLKIFAGIRVLDLEGCKSIERADLDYICSMVLLKRLCLAKTQITELPPLISNLQYLEGLNIGETQITELPPQIGKMKHLERLDVRGTQITQLPPQIGKLQNLKKLDVGRTQITHLPPQIGNLKFLERLYAAGTKITHLPVQIGNLKHLEILDIGGTRITQLPPQIGKLQNLKTLDAMKSRVMHLPDQVVQLTGLVHLLIGDNESSEGVNLPDGIGKLTSLEQLCTIDLSKCSASSLMELRELPCLKEISVVSSDKPEDTILNNVLVSSLDKSTNLRSLVVYSDFKLSTSLESSSSYKYLNCRKKLTVVKSLKVPIGFVGQHFLGMLDIRVCKLEEDDLKILRELTRLQTLIVRLEVLTRTTVRITSEGFEQLESFYVDCRMPRVIFDEGAMRKLGHLGLKLYAGSPSEEHMGIRRLLTLHKVSLWYSKWYSTNKGVEETTDAMKTEAKDHQNKITFCITEEGKDGYCTTKTEIFPQNREACFLFANPKNKEAGGIRMTEIEEVQAYGTSYNTQQEGLHQRSLSIPSSSRQQEGLHQRSLSIPSSSSEEYEEITLDVRDEENITVVSTRSSKSNKIEEAVVDVKSFRLVQTGAETHYPFGL